MDLNILFRLNRLERWFKELYCEFKNNTGGGEGGQPQDLQSVTDNGNVTNRFIQTESSVIAQNFLFDNGSVQSSLNTLSTTPRTYYLPDKTGTLALLSDISPSNGSAQMFSISEEEYTLPRIQGITLVAFEGNTTNLYLPPLSENNGSTILFYNNGLGDANIICDPSDANNMKDGGMTTNFTTLTTGSPMTIFSLTINDIPTWVTKP